MKIKIGDMVRFKTLGTKGETIEGEVINNFISQGSHVKVKVNNKYWYVPCEDLIEKLESKK